MPLTLRFPAPVTDEKLMEFSESIRPYRVERNEDGELEITSPTGLQGGSFEAYVIQKLGNWAEENGGVVISSQGGFTLLNTSVPMADGSWISPERWANLTAAEKEGFAPVCPDFLVEILSRSDVRKTLEAKMEGWIEAGARLAWMIDPYAATVTIYLPGQPTETLERPDRVASHTVVPGFRLDCTRFWPA